jgi:hypothetical protein
MHGHVAGVQVIMRKMYMPIAVYIHCWTHRLHLVIIHVCKVVPFVNDFFPFVSKIYTYFTKSSVTNKIFREAEEYLEFGKLEKIFSFHTNQRDQNEKCTIFSSIYFFNIVLFSEGIDAQAMDRN